MRLRVAWAVVALTTVAFILDTVFTAAHRPLLSEATWADHGWPLAPLAGLGYAVMGALIISRYPRHRLGWLMLAASLLSVTLATDAYSTWVLDGDGPGSAYWAHVAAWAGPLVGWPAFTAQIIIFLTAPDGRLLSARWRWVVLLAAAGLTLHTLGTLTIHPSEVVVGEDFGNRAVSLPLLTVGWMLVAAALIASVVSLVLRLRRAKDDERLQLLWIASAAALLALGVVCILAIPRIQGEEGTWLAALPLRVAQVAVPVCVAVAVLRHRLVAIDLILNRALMFTLATVVVAVGYVGVVVRGRPCRRRQHRRLLAVAVGHRRGGAGLPAATTPRHPGRRPACLRNRGGAVRGAGRPQPPTGRQPGPGGPTAGRCRGRGSGRQRPPRRGDARGRGWDRPGGHLATWWGAGQPGTCVSRCRWPTVASAWAASPSRCRVDTHSDPSTSVCSPTSPSRLPWPSAVRAWQRSSPARWSSWPVGPMTSPSPAGG